MSSNQSSRCSAFSSSRTKDISSRANNNNDINDNNNKMMKLRFITNKMCPYAQKAWIALEVCGCPYELVEISLYGSGGKPDWFWKLNPKGTVPVLVITHSKEIVLADSDLILNYLQDGGKLELSTSSPSSSLCPSSPELQASVQSWRNRVQKLLPVGKKAVLQQRQPVLSQSKELHQILSEMDQAVVGPFLTGSEITTADCHAFPFLWRLDQEYGLAAASDDDYRNLKSWLETCSKEKAFRKTIQSAWWWWW